MSHSHYLDIMLREPQIGRELHARLLVATHHRIRAGDDLAVTFPDWRDKVGEFGLLFRVFGESTALERYAETIRPLVANALVRLFPISEVPAFDSTVVFCRNRLPDKRTPSRIERHAQRAIARGETPKIHSQVRTAPNCHHLMLQSTTTGRRFGLYIERNPKMESDGGRKYGLGMRLPDF